MNASLILLLFALLGISATAESCEKNGPCRKCSECLKAGGMWCQEKTWRPKASASFAMVVGPYCVDPESNDAVCSNGNPWDNCLAFEGLESLAMPGLPVREGVRPGRLMRL